MGPLSDLHGGAPPTRATVLIAINPDLISEAGHSLYLARALAREADALGWRFASWGHLGLPTALTREHEWLMPIFEETGNETLALDAGQRARFYEHLLKWTQSTLAASPDGEVILFFYAGHPSLMVAFWRLLDAVPDPRLRVVFNLYAAHWDFDEESRRHQFMADTLQRTLASGALLADRHRFLLTSDSTLIAEHAERWWWAKVPLLPFFSLVDTSEAPSREALTSTEVITVAYPSSVHRYRGFFAYPEMVRHTRTLTSCALRFVFRTCISENTLSAEEKEICSELLGLGCEVRHGSLSSEEMRRFYSEADIILSPYPVRHFKDRTSANVADALAFGKPIVAARGTWAGRLIQELNCGEDFEDENGRSLAEAVVKVATNLPDYTRRTQEQGAVWLRENSVSTLVACLRDWRKPVAQVRDKASAVLAVEIGTRRLLELLDSAANESPYSPAQLNGTATGATSPPRKASRPEQKLARSHQENRAMKRAIEHFRASPVRALRLWMNRKQRRLTLEE